MFILLGRDPDAHNIVRLWAERRLAAGGDPEHCQMGLDTAERMRAYAADPANRPASAPDASAYRVVSVPSPRIAEGELAAFADAMRRQVDASAGNLKKSGADGHLVDICLSHFNDLADRLAALSAPSVSPSEDLGSSAKSPIPTAQTDGLVLVPREPTEAMLDAADAPFHAAIKAQRDTNRRAGRAPDAGYGSGPVSEAIWSAMIAATHQPAVPGEQGRV